MIGPLRPLYAKLRARTAARLASGYAGDDGCGSVTVTNLFVYVDDVTSMVPLVDIKFFHKDI